MSSVKVIENVSQVTNGKKVPVLEFVRQNSTLAAAVSKATPGTERVTRDGTGNRKISSPDLASLISVHRNVARRNKDAKMTFQMLPDMKLSLEMVVSLIMSPKDMFSDEIIILSDSLDLLPASIMQAMLQVTTDYFRKNYNLEEFTQHMLEQTLGYQGALPTAVIPENALDDVINNYNSNISMESWKKEFDVERNIPHPIGFLGVPDYLSDQSNKNVPQTNTLKFGREVSFNLESFEAQQRSLSGSSYRKPTTANAMIMLSKLLPKKKDGTVSTDPWKFSTLGNTDASIDADDLVSVTDNIALIKMPEYRQASLESRTASLLKTRGYSKLQTSLEAMELNFKAKMKNKINEKEGKEPTDSEVESLIFKNRRFANTPVATLRTNAQLKRNSIGEPMVKEFDTACFMPVSVEGDVTRKLGGFVMFDGEGNPLSTFDADPDEILDMASYAGGSGNFISSMNDRSNSILNGKQCSDVPPYMLKKFFTRTFGEMVEKDLIDRIKNGQYTQGAKLVGSEDWYWLMLTRCMKGQRTQLLWIPSEFLIYFAMDYDELGFGKSMLDDIRNLTSMRIMLMVSGIATSLKNSIGRTKVSIKLDEDDPDANKSIEDIQDEILKSRMNPIPFGVNNVADISRYLQRSCYEFEITGSSAIPDMEVTFDQYQTQYPKPDEELQEQLKDLTIHHWGITKDMVDAADSAEFAIQAATSNLMTMKRTMRNQRKAVPQISDLVRKISLNSESQINGLREVIENNFEQLQVEKIKRYFGIEDENLMNDESFKKLVIEQCLNAYINNLKVELPSPAATTLEAQKQMFEDAAEFYKSALDYIINESFFDTSIMGDGLSDHVDMIKNILLSHYMRDYMAKNAILPELSELTTIGEDGKTGMNVVDSMEKHIKALGMSTENFFARFKSFAIKMTGLMESVPEGSTTGEMEPSGGGGGSSGGDFGGGSDDDLFAGDDLDPFAEPGGDESEEGDDSTSTDDSGATGDDAGGADQ